MLDWRNVVARTLYPGQKLGNIAIAAVGLSLEIPASFSSFPLLYSNSLT